MLFLESEAFLCKDRFAELDKAIEKRMKCPIVPILKPLDAIRDNDHNMVYHTIVFQKQIDDVVKACRKAGVVTKTFSYDKEAWAEEAKELETLKHQSENKRKNMNQMSTDLFQETFVALMHLKVIKAHIEGILRFGISKPFMIGLVIPKKGMEKEILKQMTQVLAEPNLREYYGEKIDASEADDYWPFVSIPLTSPMHLFNDH